MSFWDSFKLVNACMTNTVIWPVTRIQLEMNLAGIIFKFSYSNNDHAYYNYNKIADTLSWKIIS